jgi:uncharacterized protein (TIGR04255 family)
MTNRLPTRLARSPLAEAVFELRFVPTTGRGVELLPGILLPALGPDFPSLEQTPIGGLPKQLREQHAELKYSAHYKLHGQGGAVLFGDRVLTVSVSDPYPGWDRFRQRSLQVAEVIHVSNHIGLLERYSLKYVNLLDVGGAGSPLAPFNVRLDAAGHDVSRSGFRLRFETTIDAHLNIVECASGATIEMRGQQQTGTLVTIDTIMEPVTGTFWTELESRLEQAHAIAKRLFYDLLSTQTLRSLGPSYD